jgi:hypothetical protein
VNVRTSAEHVDCTADLLLQGPGHAAMYDLALMLAETRTWFEPFRRYEPFQAKFWHAAAENRPIPKEQYRYRHVKACGCSIELQLRWQSRLQRWQASTLQHLSRLALSVMLLAQLNTGGSPPALVLGLAFSIQEGGQDVSASAQVPLGLHVGHAGQLAPAAGRPPGAPGQRATRLPVAARRRLLLPAGALCSSPSPLMVVEAQA